MRRNALLRLSKGLGRASRVATDLAGRPLRELRVSVSGISILGHNIRGQPWIFQQIYLTHVRGGGGGGERETEERCDRTRSTATRGKQNFQALLGTA